MRIQNCVLAVILLNWAVSYAINPNFNQYSGDISIPYYDNQIAYLSHFVPINNTDPAWVQFIERHGQWAADINLLTGNIRRIYGGSIFIGIAHDESSASINALNFINSESDIFGISASQLRLINCRHRRHLWYIEFGQIYNGLDVYMGRISIRLSDNGNLVSLENSFFRDINIPTTPALSADAAIYAANTGLPNPGNSSNPRLIIFPFPSEKGIDYRLAYQLDLNCGAQSKFRVAVDARTGELIYRKSLIYYSTVDGYIRGSILPSTPFDSLESRPFEFEILSIAGADSMYSDNDGYFSCDVADDQPRLISTWLHGTYADIWNYGQNSPVINDTITPGDTLLIEWNDEQSRRDERNVYYHTNLAHDFIKDLDPEFSGADYSMPCFVNWDEYCNAFWDGYSINFFREGDGCTNTGEIADVIYHEYGHGITDFQYRPYLAPFDLHEGWSDYQAATMTNQPLIGRGFYTGQPESYIRTVDNNNRFPDDMNGEPHNDGLIIGGALWDMREALSPRTGYSDTLFHFARYGCPFTFQDYLLEILLVDDDDNNLFNFTPNWDAIIGAFNQHGITPSDFMRMSHTALDDTPDTQNPYPVSIMVDFSLIPSNPDSMFLYYRTNFTGNFSPILLASAVNDRFYSASIPPQPALTAIEYYFSLSDMIGRGIVSPALAPTQANIFFIGSPELRSIDNLEVTSGWTIGSQDDDASSGIWLRVDPVGTYSEYQPEMPFQPEDDHTPEPGVKCYITGQQPPLDPYNNSNDVDGGQTTLISPVYNLEMLPNPLIEYYRWFVNSMNIESSFRVAISSNAGASWMPVEDLVVTENQWVRTRIAVRRYTDQFNQLRLRFIAADDGIGSIVEAGVDDIAVYNIPSTAVDDNSNFPKPAEFVLYDNYPNPFNPETQISFDLPEESDIEFTVYDIRGSLIYSEYIPMLSAGYHRITWDSSRIRNIASGIYFYKILTKNGCDSKRMLLVK